MIAISYPFTLLGWHISSWKTDSAIVLVLATDFIGLVLHHHQQQVQLNPTYRISWCFMEDVLKVPLKIRNWDFVKNIGQDILLLLCLLKINVYISKRIQSEMLKDISVNPAGWLSWLKHGPIHPSPQKRLWVQSLVGVCVEGSQSMFLSYINASLSLFLPLPSRSIFLGKV